MTDDLISMNEKEMIHVMREILEHATMVIHQGEMFARLTYSETPGRDAFLKAVVGYRNKVDDLLPKVINQKGD